MTKTKKIVAMLLALLMLSSSFSVLASAATDVTGTPTLSVKADILRNDGNGWAVTETVAPGDIVKVYVYVGTDFYSHSADLVLHYDADFYDTSDFYTDNTPALLAMNSSNSTVSGAGLRGSIAANALGAGTFTVALVSSQTTVFQYDDSTYLFSIDLKVRNDVETSSADGIGTVWVDPDDVASEDNEDGYINFPYGDQGDNRRNTLDMYMWTPVTNLVDGEATINNSVDFDIAGAVTTVSGVIGTTQNVPDPTRTGYTFTGWVSSSNDVAAPDDTDTTFAIPYETGVTFTAQYIENVTIHFDTDGGDPIADITGVTGGSAWASHPTPVKSGYKFMGWQGEGVVDGALPDNYPVAADGVNEFTYTATWKKYVEIVYDANGGTVNGNATETYTGGEGTGEIADLYEGNTWNTADVPQYNVSGYASSSVTRTGYDLLGWKLNGTGSIISTLPSVYPSDDATYVAQWDPYAVQVRLFYDDAETITQSGSQPSAAVISSIAAGSAPVDSYNTSYGSTFTVPSVTIGGDTITTWYSVDNGVVTTYSAGDTITISTLRLDLVASASEAEDFVYAIYDLEGLGTWPAGMTQTVENDGTVKISYHDGDVISDDIQSGAIVPVGNNGRTFVAWEPAISVMGDEDIVFTATWTDPQTADVYYDDEGSTGDIALYEVVIGDTVDVPEDPEKEGYTFTGWNYYTDAAHTAAYTGNIANGMPAYDLYAKAVFTPNDYPVHYDLNGSAADPASFDSAAQANPEDVTFGTALPAPAASRGAGYTFDSWSYFTDAAHTVAYTGTTMPAQDIYALASWTPNDFTITFEENEGSEVADITAAYHSSVAEPTAPTRTGYTFDGWYQEAALTNAVTWPVEMPLNGATYYAKWNVNSYDVYFDLAGGDFDSASQENPEEVAFGDALPAPAASKTGYNFAAWSYYIDAAHNTPSTDTTMPAQDLYALASWTPYTFTIDFDANGGSEVADITAAYEASITWPANPTKEGYTFDGWHVDTEAGAEYAAQTAMPLIGADNATLTLVAKWTVNPYSITYVFNDDTVDPADYDSSEYPATVNFGAALPDPDVSRLPGYTFTGWTATYNDGEDDYVLDIDNDTMPAYPVTYTAFWTPNDFTIYFNVDKDTDQDDEIDVPYGSELEFIEDPEVEGFTFAGWAWYTDAAHTTPYTGDTTDEGTMPKFDLYAVSTWDVNSYDVTYYVEGVQFGETVSYDYGDTITDPATEPEREGYRFDGWVYTYEDGNGDTQTLDIATDTMPAYDVTATAQWTEKHTVYFIYNNGTGAELDQVVATKSVPEGDAITVSDIANPTHAGYTFLGWNTDRDATARLESFGDMGNQDVYLYGIWLAGGADYTILTYTMGTDGTYGTPESITTGGTVDDAVDATPSTVATGFYLDTANADYQATGTILADNSLVLKIYIGRDKLNAVYDPDNGDSSTTLEIYYDANIAVPNAPEKEGYTFAGWSYFTDAAYTEAFSGSKMPDQDLYAKANWTVNPYTITYVFDDDAADPAAFDNANDHPASVNYGEALPNPAVSRGAGYDFVEWTATYNDGEDDYVLDIDNDTMPAYNVTYTASWQIKDFTAHYIVNEFDDPDYDDIDVTYHDDIDEPEEPELEGYTFDGWAWYTDAECTAPYTGDVDDGMPAKDLYAVALFTVNPYEIIYVFAADEADPAAFVNTDDHPDDINYGEALPNPAVSRGDGYTFDGWTVTYDDGEDEYVLDIDNDTMPAYPVFYTANWSINDFTVYYKVTEFADPDYEEIDVTYRDDIDEPDEPEREGYDFAGWTYFTDAALTAAYTGDLDDGMPAFDLYAKANWTEGDTTYILKVFVMNADGTYSATPAESQLDATTGDTVTFSIAAYEDGAYDNAGYALDTAHAGYVASATAAADGSTELVIYIARNSFTVSYDSAGGSTVGDSSFLYGAAITAPATEPEREGYDFGGWTYYTDAAHTGRYTDSTMPAQNLYALANWLEGDSSFTLKVFVMGTDGEYPASPAQTVIGATTGDTVTFEVAEYDSGAYDNAGYALDTAHAGYVASAEVAADGSTELVIYIARNSFTVSYDSNGGSTVGDSSFLYGAEITAPDTPEKEGYTFAGWTYYIDSEHTVAYNPETMPAQPLYALASWTINSYEISYDLAGDATDPASFDNVDDHPVSLNYGEALPNPEVSRGDGYTFEGWTVTYNDGEDDYVLDVDNDTVPAYPVTYTANWSLNDFTVHYIVDEFDDSDYDDIDVTYLDEIDEPEEPELEGYDFDGWIYFVDEERTTAYTGETMPAQDLYAVAQFTVHTNHIYYDYNADAVDPAVYEAADYPETHNFGETLPNPAVSRGDGYTFDGWTVTYNDGEDDYTLDVEAGAAMPDYDVYYVANWIANEFTVHYIVNEMDDADYDDIDVAYRDEIDEPEDPELEGYEFDGWTYYTDEECETVYTGDTMPASDLYAVATMNILSFTVTYEVEGEPYGAPVPYNYGATVTDPATDPERAGYRFDGWVYTYEDGNGDTQTLDIATETMPAYNVTATAQWTALHTVTFIYNLGADLETVVATKTVAEGDEITLDGVTAPTHEGYTFIGWNTDRNATARLESFGNMGTQDVTLYGIWLAGGANYTILTYTMDANGTYGQPVEVVTGGTVDDAVDATPSTVATGFYLDTANADYQATGTILADNSLVLKIYIGRNQYTVTYKPENGDAATDVDYYFGAYVSDPATDPVKTGYNFEGWVYTYEDGEGATQTLNIATDTMPAYDVTATAQWSNSGVALTLDADGGEFDNGNEHKDVTVTYGDVIGDTLDANEPTKPGYDFIGWSISYEDGEGATVTLDKDDTMPAYPVTATAIWAPYDIIVKYYVDGEYVMNGTAVYGEPYTVAAYTADGSTVTEWTRTATDITYAPGDIYVPGEDDLVSGIIFRAETSETETCVIRFLDDEGNVLNSAEYEIGAVIVAPEDPAKVGYTFISWDHEPGIANGDEDFIAVFAPSIKTVTFTVDGETYEEIDVPYGETVDFPEDPEKEGYDFIGWKDSGGNLVTDETAITDDTVLTAYFDAHNHTVTYVLNNGEESVVQPYDFGAAVTAYEVSEREGYTFGGWYYDNETFANAFDVTTMPDEDLVFYAKWTKNNYPVTFNANGGKFSDESEVYTYQGAYGDSITAPETDPTRTGYDFVGWEPELGTVSADPNDNVFMATWNAHEATVTYKVNADDAENYDVITANFGESLDDIEPEDPEVEGFNGWVYYTDPEYTTPYEGDTVPDYPLYALADIASAGFAKLVPVNTSSTAMIERGGVVETYNEGILNGTDRLPYGATGAVEAFSDSYGDYASYSENATEYDSWYIYGLTRGLTVANLSRYITVTNDGYYEVEGAYANRLVGTGTIIKVYDKDGNFVEQFRVVIYGDIDGNASINGNDTTAGKQEVSSRTWSSRTGRIDYIFRAADLDQNGAFNATDATNHGRVVSNVMAINQITGRAQ